MIQHIGGAAQVECPVAQQGDHLVDHAPAARPEGIQRVGGRGQVVEDLLEGLAAEAAGEGPAGLAELLAPAPQRGGERPGGDPAGVGHQHRQGPVLIERHQLDSVQRGVLERWREQHAHHVRARGQQGGRLRHQAFGRVGLRHSGRLAHRGRLARHPRHALEVIHVEAVGGVRGDPARRGVGLHQVSQLLEVGHRVADGGRGEAADVPPGHGVRADGLAGLDVLRDDGQEDLAAPLIEGRAGHARSYR